MNQQTIDRLLAELKAVKKDPARAITHSDYATCRADDWPGLLYYWVRAYEEEQYKTAFYIQNYVPKAGRDVMAECTAVQCFIDKSMRKFDESIQKDAVEALTRQIMAELQKD